jgi:ribosomal protein L4
MNKKTVLLGLKTALSARLAEGGVTVFDDFPNFEKTREYKGMFPTKDTNEQVLFVTETGLPEDFINPLNHLNRVNTISPEKLNTKHVVKHASLYFTKSSLQQL